MGREAFVPNILRPSLFHTPDVPFLGRSEPTSKRAKFTRPPPKRGKPRMHAFPKVRSCSLVVSLCFFLETWSHQRKGPYFKRHPLQRTCFSAQAKGFRKGCLHVRLQSRRLFGFVFALPLHSQGGEPRGPSPMNPPQNWKASFSWLVFCAFQENGICFFGKEIDYFSAVCLDVRT